MLRTILLALDGSEDGAAAYELALRWAKAYDAQLIGCAILDEPGIRSADATVLTEVYFGGLDLGALSEARRAAEAVLRSFLERCAEAGVRGQAMLAAGEPHERLIAEAHRVDLVVMGRRTHFQYGSRKTDENTLDRVVQECPRPVVAVPAKPTGDDSSSVVVAFDGSVHASRALYSFEASGLARDREVHLVSVDRDRDVATGMVERAVTFLKSHGVDARPHPFDGAYPPVEAILAATVQLSAGLLVIGAYGHGQLREFFVGSSTRTVFTRSTVPVFCTH